MILTKYGFVKDHPIKVVEYENTYVHNDKIDKLYTLG